MDNIDKLAHFFNPEDAGLSENETAEILGVKPETLATWRSKGRGPKFRKNGRRVEYPVKFVRAYQQDCERTPEPAAIRRQRRAASISSTA
jgi:hypothetical protein